MTDNAPVLRTRGLRKEYGTGEGLVRAVDEVDLDVAPGETVAVMGPSGCGKSTLLHLLGGLDRPSGGELWLAGRRIDQLSERALAWMRRNDVGFVFQAFHLMEELTAVENVELPALLAGRSPRAARRQAADLLKRVGLVDGLFLRETGSDPYQSTREATAGPDVIASTGPSDATPADVASLEALTDAPGVVGHSGPYPMIGARLEASGGTAGVWAQGRDPAAASIDQPKLTRGSWVRDGGVVVEAGLAAALDVGEEDHLILNGRSFQVVGVAVTAAASPYPNLCYAPCWFGAWEPGGGDLPPPPDGSGPRPVDEPDVLSGPPVGDSGLVWLTEADARGLAPAAEALSYIVNLRLADPAEAPAFVDTHGTIRGPALATWQDILDMHTNVVQDQQLVLLSGSWLVGSLAVASIAVLAGGRMADQTRRVGLLKAVGGTPRLVAAVLLAEYVVVALLAAAAGLAAGWLAAPLLIDGGAGLVGSAGAPSLTMSRVGLVTAVALMVAVVATTVPAIRAARTSTVRALADSARPPRRAAWLIAISARLPGPLLLGLRVAGRRPRRVVLGVVSIAITVSGIVAALAARAQLAASVGTDELHAANRVLLVITVMLVALAAVNAIFITWATALDARHSSALARALGATPREVSAGLSAAQVLPGPTPVDQRLSRVDPAVHPRGRRPEASDAVR